MEIEYYLKNELDFELRSSHKKEPPSLPFLPSGYYQEFVRGRWCIKLLDTISGTQRRKIGVMIEVDLPTRKHVLFRGYINSNDSLTQLKRLLYASTDILDSRPMDYPCERVNIKPNGTFHNSGFIHKYYIWEFDDLLSSTVPPGYNILVPYDIPIDECIDFINGYLLNIGAPNTDTKSSSRIPSFNTSYITHFNNVGVNVLDVDLEGRMFIDKDFVKDTNYGLKNVESVYVIRISLKAVKEDRIPETIEFLKDVGLVKDMIIGCTIHGEVRISFINNDLKDIEVSGSMDRLVRYFERKFGPL